MSFPCVCPEPVLVNNHLNNHLNLCSQKVGGGRVCWLTALRDPAKKLLVALCIASTPAHQQTTIISDCTVGAC
eukprot:COSAG06_NODE_4682_length_4037_cov_11.317166_1_plen_72_part_10